MDWVKDFYSKQGQWCSCYQGPISKEHRENVLLLHETVGSPPKRLLELGAGGGQFAVAAASKGYDVVAVELIQGAYEHAQGLAKSCEKGGIQLLLGDFYTLAIGGKFDAICYWDGFGIGDDEDQQILLKKIHEWLQPGGKVLMDIYNPWYWALASGKNLSFGPIQRKYGFDPYGSRMLDSWCSKDDRGEVVTQSLRCYSPADLKLLLLGSGLQLLSIKPRGGIHEESNRFYASMPLEKAMTYKVLLGQVNENKGG